MKRPIFIFEDKEAVRSDIYKNLKNRLRKTKILCVKGDGQQQQNKTYEDQIEELFQIEAPNGGFVISDKDLSDLGNQFRGLSGTAVATVADNMGFPLCLYARGEGQLRGEEFLKSLAPWEKKRIIIESNTNERIAEQCALIYRAFSNIETRYFKLKKSDRGTLSAALSKILEKPGIEDRIALYGTGEQGFLQEIMPYQKENQAGTEKELNQRTVRLLGNWLYTSILRFPGILVNNIAAASYLNINLNDFNKTSVKEIFEKARYKGPFSNLYSGMTEWWWRHELDTIIFSKDCEDGLAYTKFKKVKGRVRPCKDPQTKERAGYYCMVTEKPVSEKNSKSGISWFPAGADLARIRSDKFNELAPWIGLY